MRSDRAIEPEREPDCREQRIVRQCGDLRGSRHGRAMTATLAYGERCRLTPEHVVAELFETARDDVYRYLLTLGLAPAQAQEATQEVFLRLYAAMRKGQNIENPRAWIFRVAHNHGLTLRGRERAVRPLDPELELRIPDRAGSAE